MDGRDEIEWWEKNEAGQNSSRVRWRAMAGGEELHGELSLGKYEPHETREEDGEQEEKMANPMRASGWPDVA